MILFWGLENDDPLCKAMDQVHNEGIPYFFIDQKKIDVVDIRLSMPDVGGFIKVGDKSVDIREIKAAYFRPYDIRNYKFFQGDSTTIERYLRFERLLWAWAEITDAFVLNKPSAMLSNNSKPFQTLLINKCGIKTPISYYTNSPKYIKTKQTHSDLIYKSISSIRSIVHKIERDDNLKNVTSCITQFQNYVDGENVRVHVVDNEIFATKILSESTDYRYNNSNLIEIQLSNTIKENCFKLSRELNLLLCGIDFKVNSEGEWICFEVNPSPAYSYYENATGQLISTSIANLLIQESTKSVFDEVVVV